MKDRHQDVHRRYSVEDHAAADLADDSSLKTVVIMSGVGAHLCMPASAYQTTKYALLRLTDFLNVEYGEKELVAYCVHPGSVPTELAWKMPDFFKVNLN